MNVKDLKRYQRKGSVKAIRITLDNFDEVLGMDADGCLCTESADDTDGDWYIFGLSGGEILPDVIFRDRFRVSD